MNKRGSRWERAWLLVHLGLLLFGALGWTLPLLWTIAVSFRPADEPLVPGHVWFGSHFTLENYTAALSAAPFVQYYVNTLTIVFGILLVQLITITLAGFAFARYHFPGQTAIFLVCLLQIIIPSAALIVPNYTTIRTLGLFDSRLAIMLPYFGSAFGTFLMRQTFKGVPRDLDDAARMDGCSWWQTLWHIYIPSSTSALVAFSLVSISFHWSEFLWPLVVTNSPKSRPLTVGLAVLTQYGELGAQWGLVTAGTLLVVVPLLILFMIFQRQFTDSFVHSGFK